MYGHAVSDGDDDLWLQYWFFYFYNDYNLIGKFLQAGLHEGDWEMIQIRLDGRARPTSRSTPSTRTPSAATGAGRHRAGHEAADRLRRARFARVLLRARTQWTGHWFDHADGKRNSPELTLDIVDDDDPDCALDPLARASGATRRRATTRSTPTAPRGRATTTSGTTR